MLAYPRIAPPGSSGSGRCCICPNQHGSHFFITLDRLRSELDKFLLCKYGSDQKRVLVNNKPDKCKLAILPAFRGRFNQLCCYCGDLYRCTQPGRPTKQKSSGVTVKTYTHVNRRCNKRRATGPLGVYFSGYLRAGPARAVSVP